MKKTFLFLALVAMLGLSACSSSTPAPTAQPTEPPPPPPPTNTPVPSPTPEPTENVLVFASTRGEGHALDLYLINVDTLDITPIETGGDAVFPQWYPDGSRIGFAIPGIWNLYTIAPDGSELTQITDFRSNNMDWSPDGTRVVFQSDAQNEPQDTPDIYWMEVPESGLGENVTEILDSPPTLEFGPRWSPLGDKIAYISNETGKSEIFTINVDGTEKTQMTESKGEYRCVEWSPDGKQFVYTYADETGQIDLYIVDATTPFAEPIHLTNDEFQEFYPAWSPDGTRIAFSSNRSNGNWDLWLIDADGNNLTQLTDDEAKDLFPDWKP